ncbi:hypothetical protein [Sporomusa malonica]|uniref:Uncharacterized protein n=1 Tax=Sporomusa malonica TaxID=112901 RepID=A0A1W2E308_9FIRM|nr:hypothetical protein [Sporomusa malonica]SMD03458.1 hypothetical protein SAMN04488500_119103 [Sporomusa malonica]
MNKKVILGFAAGIIVAFAALFYIGATDEPDKKPVTKPPTSQTSAAAPAPQAAVKDYRKYLTAEDLINITGTKFKMTYADMKFNGKPDLTFSTTDEGHIVLTVTVLPGSHYEKIYSEFRSQEYKTMENAFWGPKNENPPRMLGFRKGDTTITVTRYVDDGRYPITVEMMERIAKTIAARL